MAFTQDQHEAHDPLVTMTPETANEAADILEGMEGKDEDEQAKIDSLADALNSVAGETEGATITSEQAGLIAGLIRDNGGDTPENENLLSQIDSVAKQHDVAKHG